MLGKKYGKTFFRMEAHLINVDSKMQMPSSSVPESDSRPWPQLERCSTIINDHEQLLKISYQTFKCEMYRLYDIDNKIM